MYSAEKYLLHPASDRLAPVNNGLSGGLPHSEISGSKVALTSPELIAECHVLHRLLPPRHPPDALIALDCVPEDDRRATFAGSLAAGLPG